jgi:hypothetical protein
MMPPSNDDLQREWALFDDHREHVLEIMKEEVGDAFPPNGTSLVVTNQSCGGHNTGAGY